MPPRVMRRPPNPRYVPVDFIDFDNVWYSGVYVEAAACDIDVITGNILIGYRFTQEGETLYGCRRSWIHEIDTALNLVSSKRIYTIDNEHGEFKLVDVDKVGTDVLAVAEGPASYGADGNILYGRRATLLNAYVQTIQMLVIMACYQMKLPKQMLLLL